MTRIAFFAFDISEASQIRRIEAVRSLGHEVVSVSFRRDNMNAGFVPDWLDLALGRTRNERIGRRLVQLGVALFCVLQGRRLLDGTDVWIARNLDMLLLAWAARVILRRGDARLVYECLDIHGLLTRRGLVGSAARRVERFLLRRCALLIVSSPGFLREYFVPVQGFAGQAALVENKLWFQGPTLPRPAAPPDRDDGAPLVLGCVGSIRCRQSLMILAEVADRLGPAVRVAFHGNVHRHAVPEFDAVVAARANVSYHGAYRYPDGLAAAYAACDLVWAQDLWQSGANSDWLLPNRIYEASWFGCPSIAVAETETGRAVAGRRLGRTVPTASAGALADLLASLDRPSIRAMSQALLDMPDDAFRLTAGELREKLAPVLQPDGPGRRESEVPA